MPAEGGGTYLIGYAVEEQVTEEQSSIAPLDLEGVQLCRGIGKGLSSSCKKESTYIHTVIKCIIFRNHKM